MQPPSRAFILPQVATSDRRSKLWVVTYPPSRSTSVPMTYGIE